MHGHEFTPYMHELIREVTGKFCYAYCREDLRQAGQAMLRARGSSAYPSRKNALVTMLRRCSIDCGSQTGEEQLLALAEQVPDRQQCQRMLLRELHAMYREFPTAEDFMTRLVRRLADPDFAGDSVRLTIVKQFMRYTDYHTAAIKTYAKTKYALSAAQAKDLNCLIAAMGEDIFDVLEQIQTMDKAHRRDARRKYALLKLADDLAFGRFRTNGKTKTDLYMFAFAFGMTVYTGALGDVQDPDRDVEKNLFRDYYQDNLLRYISQDYLLNFRKYDSEPTGEGINYKNYAEVIYIYYLRKTKSKADARKNIKKAESLIERCLQQVMAQRNAGEEPKENPGLITDDYKELFVRELWDMDEDGLVQCLCSNFDFPEDVQDKSRIVIRWEEFSALNNYLDLLDQLEDVTDNSQMWNGAEPLFDRELAVQMGLDADFLKLLDKMEQLVRLRLPSAAVAMAGVRLQEGKQVDNLLLFAAGLDVLEDWLREAEDVLVQASRQQEQLRDGLTERFGPANAWHQAEEEVRVYLLRLRAILREVKTRRRGLQEQHAHLQQIRRRACQNFRERMEVLRTENVSEDMLTVCANMRQLREQLDGVANETRQLTETLPPLYERMQEAVRQLHSHTGSPMPQPVSEEWLVGYADRIENIRQKLLLPLQCLAETALSEKPCREVLPQAVAERANAYREEMAGFFRLSRTALIAIHYQHMLCSEEYAHKSMPELFEVFCDLVNPVLDACRYQPVSEKNLFDMFTLFSLYHKRNLEI